MPEKRQPVEIWRVGGREFRIYMEYDESLQRENHVYPDFEERPEYTGEGRPFATSAQEGCPHYKPVPPDGPNTDDCGGCGWFHREHMPYDAIGVCMCDARRRTPQAKR